MTSLLPTLSLPLPSLGGNAGADDAASGAYFDVGYLDDELLVILQNQACTTARCDAAAALP